MELSTQVNLFGSDWLGPKPLYVSKYHTIPSTITFNDIDLIKYEKKYCKQFILEYKAVNNKRKRLFGNREEKGHDVYCYSHYIATDNQTIFIYLEQECESITLYYVEETEYVKKLIEQINHCFLNKEHRLGLITLKHNDLNIDCRAIDKITFEQDNYHEDLIELDKEILKNLEERNFGCYLIYGEVGTGKSRYIQSLISRSNKEFVFITTHSAQEIDQPNFISFALEKLNNCVLIIEDAEKLIVNREKDSCSPVNSLLNITDGIIGQILNIQIICTFNTEVKNIDKALLRKGRLINSYEFKALSVEKSNNLLKKMNIDYITDKPMTLAEIYNFNDQGFEVKKKGEIGFKKN